MCPPFNFSREFTKPVQHCFAMTNKYVLFECLFCFKSFISFVFACKVVRTKCVLTSSGCHMAAVSWWGTMLLFKSDVCHRLPRVTYSVVPRAGSPSTCCCHQWRWAEGLGFEPWRPIWPAMPHQPKGPSSWAEIVLPASFYT